VKPPTKRPSSRSGTSAGSRAFGTTRAATIARKLGVRPERFLIGSTGAGPVATVMVGRDASCVQGAVVGQRLLADDGA
jgi:hypothetical protein